MPVVNLTIKIDADGRAEIANVTGDLAKLDTSANKTTGGLGALKGMLGSITSNPAFGIAAGAASALFSAVTSLAAATAFAISTTAAYGSGIADLAAKHNISTKAAQEYQLATKLVGVANEDVAKGISRLQNEVVKGNGAFQQLGLDLQKLRQSSPEQMFNDVGSAISRIKNPAEQTAAAIAIFGKAGAELLPVMKQDLAAVADEAQRMGLVLSEEAIAATDEFDDSVAKLQLSWEGLIHQFGAAALEGGDLTKVVDEIRRGIEQLIHFVQDNKDTIGAMFTVAARAVRQFAEDVVTFLGSPQFRQAMNMITMGASERFIADVNAERDAANNRVGASGEGGFTGPGLSFAGGHGGGAGSKGTKYTARQALDMGPQISEVDRIVRDAELRFQEQYAEGGFSHLQPVFGELALTAEELAEAFEFLNQQAVESNRRFGEKIVQGLDIADAVMSALGPAGERIRGAVGDTGAAANLGRAALSGDVVGGLGAGAQLAQGGGALGMYASVFTGGGLLNTIGGLFGGKNDPLKAAAREAQDLRDQFIDAAGGLQELERNAAAAGVSLDALFDAKNAREYEDAVRDINEAIASQEEAHEAVNEAMQRHGINIEEMGTKWAQAELDKKAAQLLQDQRLLTAAGAENALVLERMAPAYNEYVQASMAAGTAIPENMRPALQQLADMGLLTDAAGNKLSSLDGLSFTESLSDGLTRAIDGINRLVDALNRAPREITTTYNVLYKESYAAQNGIQYNPGGGEQAVPIGGDPLPEYAAGIMRGSFGLGTLALLHGTESVVPEAGEEAFAREVLGGSSSTTNITQILPVALNPDTGEMEPLTPAQCRRIQEAISGGRIRVPQRNSVRSGG